MSTRNYITSAVKYSTFNGNGNGKAKVSQGTVSMSFVNQKQGSSFNLGKREKLNAIYSQSNEGSANGRVHNSSSSISRARTLSVCHTFKFITWKSQH